MHIKGKLNVGNKVNGALITIIHIKFRSKDQQTNA